MAASALLVRNGSVVIGGDLVTTDVFVEGDAIVHIGAGADRRTGSAVEVVDAGGLIVAPGFIDLQVNGGWGHDFTTDAASIAEVAERLASSGVTAFLPTIVTSAPQQRRAAMAAIAGHVPVRASAVPLGLHFEGPMIAASRVGAHAPEWVGPVAARELAGWSSGGGVRLVTIAPEFAGAPDIIAGLVQRGVVVSIGHTACTPAQFAVARSAGANAVTHLYNAMAPFSHRAPGPIGATLADDRVVASLICDGLHVDPTAVAVAWQNLGPHRTLLVTDATAALGLGSGANHVRLGNLDVVVGPDGVRSPSGVLAGSNLAMDAAVRNLVAYTGCSPVAAIGCATEVPADLLGLTDRGRLAVGARADLVLLDDSLRPRQTIIGGITAWRS